MTESLIATPQPPPVWPPCVCGHRRIVHDIAGDKHTRTKCLTWRGPKGTPCGCRRYMPEVA
jgi:hypothetical protein